MRKKSPAAGDDASVAGGGRVLEPEKRRLKRNSFCAAAFRIRPSAGREAERAGASVPPVGSAAVDAAVRRRNGGRQSAYPCALSF